MLTSDEEDPVTGLDFWATPSMTIAHVLFALLATGYTLIAIRLEERDLLAVHAEYKGYRERALMLIPRFKETANSRTSVGEAAGGGPRVETRGGNQGAGAGGARLHSGGADPACCGNTPRAASLY